MNIARLLMAIVACCSITARQCRAEAEGKASPLPEGWRCPPGWRVDDWVKVPFVDASLTGDGKITRAVLITNGKIERLVAFLGYKIGADFARAGMRSYLLFEGGLPSNKEGLTILRSGQLWLPQIPEYVETCGEHSISCNKDGVPILLVNNPTLFFQWGDYGYAFPWWGPGRGFKLLQVGG